MAMYGVKIVNNKFLIEEDNFKIKEIIPDDIDTYFQSGMFGTCITFKNKQWGIYLCHKEELDLAFEEYKNIGSED
jgi:hypothetical protein